MLPAASLMQLNSPARRETIVVSILRARYGTGTFPTRAIDEILRSKDLVRNWLRAQWEVWDRLDLYPLDLPQSARRCPKCRRHSNSTMAKSCRGCGQPLKPWEGRERYLSSLKWKTLTSRQCANVRRRMILHGSLQQLPDGMYQVKGRRTPDEEERWEATLKQSRPSKRTSKEHIGYESLLVLMEMLPLLVGHALRQNEPLPEPFENLDPAMVRNRITKLAAEWQKTQELADAQFRSN